jgi:hypothetical protein
LDVAGLPDPDDGDSVVYQTGGDASVLAILLDVATGSVVYGEALGAV